MMTTDDNHATRVAPPADAGAMPEAEIDENLSETFPASDPPSWTLGTDHREKSSDSARPTTSHPDDPADDPEVRPARKE